mmetsp:Transcript_2197/g.8040  ORF Transcript_2197/g.8040 Transcript_2197/m.8040 type:complete len:247 (+) Transcript_2197:213-953(+)
MHLRPCKARGQRAGDGLVLKTEDQCHGPLCQFQGGEEEGVEREDEKRLVRRDLEHGDCPLGQFGVLLRVRGAAVEEAEPRGHHRSDETGVDADEGGAALGPEGPDAEDLGEGVAAAADDARRPHLGRHGPRLELGHVPLGGRGRDFAFLAVDFEVDRGGPREAGAAALARRRREIRIERRRERAAAGHEGRRGSGTAQEEQGSRQHLHPGGAHVRCGRAARSAGLTTFRDRTPSLDAPAGLTRGLG